MSKDDLRQADLSNLTITEMTPAQRAELKRRYSHFVESFGHLRAAHADGERILREPRRPIVQLFHPHAVPERREDYDHKRIQTQPR